MTDKQLAIIDAAVEVASFSKTHPYPQEGTELFFQFAQRLDALTTAISAEYPNFERNLRVGAPARTPPVDGPFEDLSDEELNRKFTRAFWPYAIDERNNTWQMAEGEEWRPLPDFVNDWSQVRKMLAQSKVIVTPDFVPRTDREFNRRVMIALLRHAQVGKRK